MISLRSLIRPSSPAISLSRSATTASYNKSEWKQSTKPRLSKWFEPRSISSWYGVIVRVIAERTTVGDWLKDKFLKSRTGESTMVTMVNIQLRWESADLTIHLSNHPILCQFNNTFQWRRWLEKRQEWGVVNDRVSHSFLFLHNNCVY